MIDKKVALGENDKRSLVDLINDQVEFADVLIINKTDLVDNQKLNELKEVFEVLC